MPNAMKASLRDKMAEAYNRLIDHAAPYRRPGCYSGIRDRRGLTDLSEIIARRRAARISRHAAGVKIGR